MTDASTSNTIRLTGFFIAFAGAILFSTKAIIVKLAFAYTGTDAVTLLMLRMLFALPFYIIVAYWQSNNKANSRFTPRQWVIIIFLGLAGYYLSSLFDFIGLQYVSAGLERLILFLYPTFAVFINIFFFKEKIKTYQKWALALTYTGIAIAYVGEININNSSPDFYWGTFLIFLCSVTFSIYIAGSGRVIQQTGAAKFTAYAMIVAATGVVAHYFISGRTIHYFSTTLIGYGIVLAIVATVLPTFFISYAMKLIGTNNVAIISSIGPVSTIIQAYFILHENMFSAQIAGTILVIAGILLIGWKTREN